MDFWPKIFEEQRSLKLCCDTGPSTRHNITRPQNSGRLSDPFDQTHIGHIPAHCVGAANLTFE